MPASFRIARDADALFYHFVNCTSEGFSFQSNKKDLYIWDQSIRKHVMSHNFLYHGVLSTASLHLAVLKPDESSYYVTEALEHQNIALAQFRSSVQNVSAHNCEAALAFSGLLAISTLAFSIVQNPGISPSFGSLEDLQCMVSLFQGVKALYCMSWMRGLDCHLSSHIRAKVVHGSFSEMPASDAEKQLQNLETNEIANQTNESLRVIQQISVTSLRITFRRIAANPGVADIVLRWPANVSSGYINSLQNRESASLVILAYWGVALHSIDNYWWVKGWGPKIVKLIAQEVEPAYLHYLLWPRQQADIL